MIDKEGNLLNVVVPKIECKLPTHVRALVFAAHPYVLCLDIFTIIVLHLDQLVNVPD